MQGIECNIINKATFPNVTALSLVQIEDLLAEIQSGNALNDDLLKMLHIASYHQLRTPIWHYGTISCVFSLHFHVYALCGALR